MRKKRTASISRPRSKRPSKFDRIIEAAEHGYAHTATTDIMRRRMVIGKEIEVFEMEISELVMRLKNAKLIKANLEAEARGLSKVVAKRC